MKLLALGTDIWRVDGPDIVFAGAKMHTRMTIARLDDGSLWVHSPIQWSDEVSKIMQELGGTVSALIAPNKFHHLFIEQWRQEYPEAVVYAETTVQQKIEALADAETLTDETPAAYASDIDQVIFGGNRLFQEAVFFHRKSKTVIFTDLFINLSLDGINFFAGLFLRFEQVVYPDGGLPRLYRLLTRDKRTAKAALEKILAWEPQQLTFCHGHDLEGDAQTILRSQFSYLL